MARPVKSYSFEFKLDLVQRFLAGTDRQIISYAIGSSPNLELTNASLRDALGLLEDGQKPLVHSDRGVQYQHVSWRTLLKDSDAVQSMSGKGNCYDNAVMENFFGHLKEELFHRI